MDHTTHVYSRTIHRTKETVLDSLIQFGWFNPCATTRTKDNKIMAHFVGHE